MALELPMAIQLKPEWLKQIAETSPTAIIILDQDRIICFGNVAAARMANVQSEDQLIGKPYLDIVAQYKVLDERGETLPPSKFPSTQAFTHGQTTHSQHVAQVTKEGKHFWLDISSYPIFNDRKEVTHVIVRFADVSERKIREDRLRFLVESSKTLSVDGDIRTRIAERARLFVPSLADWCTVNIVGEDGSLERYAVVHRDPSKTKLVEQLAIRSAEHPDALIRRVIHTGRPELYPRITMPGADTAAPSELHELWERLQPCSALSVPIRAQGRILGVLSLAYSESNRTYTTDDLDFFNEYGSQLGVVIENSRLYAEIEKRDKSKDRFLATLSHELRNPLAPIKNSLELLKLTTVQHDTESREELTLIEHQFDHLSKLLRDLLDITRYTQSKIRIDLEPLDLVALVRNALRTQEAFLHEKQLELQMSLPDYPLRVSADALRIEQALINLIHNAGKFTPPGGRITVIADQKNEHVRLAIRDTGIGIEKEDLRKIFDAYYQVDAENTHGSGGLGMGLQLVQQIVRLHHGTIEAFSDGPGTGSTFLMTLPLLDAAPADTIRESETAMDSTPIPSKKVLVVDDNQAAADSLVKLLGAIGMQAQAVYSGAEAIQIFDTFLPDVTFVDIGLPDMSGHEVIAELKKKNYSFYGVALSGYGQPEDKKRAREAGFDEHITKPVGLKEIREVLGAA